MTVGRVVVLSGGSSSGKSSIARVMLELLAPTPWVTFGVDSLIEGLPPWLGGDGGGLDMADDGSISVGSAFTVIEDAWNRGLAAMVRAGVNLVLDEVLLSGAESQARVRAAFGDLDVLWVGVRCTPELAAEREAARGDRVVGQAAHQAATAHEGVIYDLEVDTSTTSSDEAARTIVATLDAVAPGG